MEEQETKNNVKKHLTSLHKRVQYKYLEMQKKMEKSRSVDSISALSDDYSHQDFTYGSLDDLREAESEVFVSENELRTQSLVVENVFKQNATSHDVALVEATFSEVENSANSSGDWEKVETASIDTRTNVSVESLTEVGKESDDSQRLTPTPPPRTIRERLFARRERRREEKEKQNQIKKEKQIDKLILSNTKLDSVRLHKKSKLATVTVALIEASNLESISDGKDRLLFCRYRLGGEKGKSKVVKSSASVVKWQELMNINMFDEHMLELSCFDKNIFVGRHVLDLSELEKEKTHKLRLDLHDGEVAGVKIFVLLTISGMSLLNSIIEVDNLEDLQKKMIQSNSSNDVGSLTVIVYEAKGLSAQDCYCVLKLVNERLHTHTEYKTQEPKWMKLFTFNLTDITRILEVTVVDEKKGEEVGKISIPLLRIHDGEKVWYALKDSSQRERAKGNNPRILLEMRTSWNILKASIRVINPKEEDLLEVKRKLDRRLFARNLSRAKAVVNWVLGAFGVVKTCFEWESRKSNLIALFIWILFCYFFKIWMMPLLLLIPFVKYRPEEYYVLNSLRLYLKMPVTKEIVVAKEDVKEEKSSLMQKINSLAEMVSSVQNYIGKAASFGESVKNLFNFTVPFISLLAVFFILLITFIMFIIPLKYILIGWGIHKFTRKILRPNRIPNSEILDLLSRVPDDETLLDCEEFLTPTSP